MTKFPVSILHQQLKMKQYGRGETVQKNHRLFLLKTSVGKVRMSTHRHHPGHPAGRWGSQSLVLVCPPQARMPFLALVGRKSPFCRAGRFRGKSAVSAPQQPLWISLEVNICKFKLRGLLFHGVFPGSSPEGFIGHQNRTRNERIVSKKFQHVPG